MRAIRVQLMHFTHNDQNTFLFPPESEYFPARPTDHIPFPSFRPKYIQYAADAVPSFIPSFFFWLVGCWLYIFWPA